MCDCIEQWKIKKFWEELIFHFSMLWHGPYANNNVRVAPCVFVACLSNRCLEKLGVYTYRQTEDEIMEAVFSRSPSRSFILKGIVEGYTESKVIS
jgi:hypothetical protein